MVVYGVYGHRQRPEGNECEASMAYTGSTCISLKEKKNGGSKTDLWGECPQNPYDWVKRERRGFRGKVVLLL